MPPAAGHGPIPRRRNGRPAARRLRPASAALICLLVLTAAAGCGRTSGDPRSSSTSDASSTPGGASGSGGSGSGTSGSGGTSSPSHARFSDSGVDVDAWLVRTSPTRADLSVRLTPEPDYHLYSLDLPDAGIAGLGRPTKVRLVSGLTALDRSRADRPVVQLELSDLGVVLPVYPAGPVTVTVPVQLHPGARASIAVSYASCSATRCRTPVADHPLQLPQP